MRAFYKDMSNEEYQERFAEIRAESIKMNKTPLKGKRIRKVRCEGDYFNYLIADVLRTIRKHRVDYVISEAHVLELLKYEPEKLRVRYLPEYEYFEVSLA